MKKLNKKGFTIVELSIVIAVVAILSAVMIPTFASIINKSKNSVALQEAKNAYTEYLGAEFDYETNEDYAGVTLYFKASNDRYVIIKNGVVDKKAYENEAEFLKAVKGDDAENFEVTEIENSSFVNITEKAPAESN